MLLQKFKPILFLFIGLCAINRADANNINVSNVSITGQNLTNDFSMVKFNLSWENSWRISSGPANWDAAWVFVKFRVGAADPTFTGASSSGTTVTVSSTANLRVGMPVHVTGGTGAFAVNTVISSITNSTQFVVSTTPLTPLSGASIQCRRIWEHARLNNTGHTAPSGGTIDVPADGTGAFIYFSSNGSGTCNFNNTHLRWNYGINNVADEAVVSVQVFAIEMVYVPQGSFFVGTRGTENGSFTDGSVSTATATASISGGSVNSINLNFGGSGYSSATVLISGGGGSGAAATATISGGAVTGVTVTNAGSGYTSAPTVIISAPNSIPFEITSEAALGIDNAAGKLWGTSSTGSNSIGNAPEDLEATLAASFPKGVAAFYCMKYEISQGQYRDFLNTLTYQQQVSRTVTSPNSAAGTGALSSTNAFRSGIDIQTPGDPTTFQPAVYGCNLNGNTNYNESGDGEWIACNWLSWMDGCAYMDWAGLRPMTELELEKACRGNQAPVSWEYAWGNATTTSANAIANGGEANETTNTLNANSVSNNNIQGPLRVGAFAGAATSRVHAGATYYGIMEMSGNLWERPVSIGNEAGRSFTGLHGDGNLVREGNANVNFWPGINGNSTTTIANTVFGGTIGVTQAAGSCFRGGHWQNPVSVMPISARPSATVTQTARDSWYGFRGVRTAQ